MKKRPDDSECAQCYHDRSQHNPECEACAELDETCVEFIEYPS